MCMCRKRLDDSDGIHHVYRCSCLSSSYNGKCGISVEFPFGEDIGSVT